jgi:hypothetical protein
MPNVGQELLNVPFSEMVTKLALGIAQGQTALDLNSTEVAKFMSETTIKLPATLKDVGTTTPPTIPTLEFPLIAMGFFPGYYQFQEAVIEVKMAITMATTTDTSVGATAKVGWGPFAASVNASYSSKYEYKVEGSSLLRVTLKPVPPPKILQDYMENLIKTMPTLPAPTPTPAPTP